MNSLARPDRVPDEGVTRARSSLAIVSLLLAIVVSALQSSATAAVSGCINSDCPAHEAGFTYNNGPLITSPHVYLVRFSNSTTTLSPASGYPAQTFSPTAPNIAGAISAVVSNPATTWWMSEYSTPTYQMTAGSYGGVITLYSPALADSFAVTGAQIEIAVYSAMNEGLLPDTSSDAVYIALMRTTQRVSSIYGDCPYHGQFSANTASVTYLVLDNYSASGHCVYASPFTLFNNMTQLLSYLLVETITDPSPPSGWASRSGMELGGICAFAPSPFTGTLVRYQGATYDLKYFWSAGANACIAKPLSTRLTASFSNARTIAVSLSAQGHPLRDQMISVSSNQTLLATGMTNAMGRASIHISPLSSKAKVFVTLRAGAEFLHHSISIVSPITSVVATTSTTPSTVTTTTTTTTG